MPWTIKNISPTVNWNIKNISSIIGWGESPAHNVIRWNYSFKKWEEYPILWPSIYKDTNWLKTNINIRDNKARDYEWDDSEKIWSAMDTKWDEALTEGISGWALSTKDAELWQNSLISD